MRILGIDFGTKRVGLAISDELGMLARELSIMSPVQFFRSLQSLITDYEVEAIVVGMPVNMSGQDTAKTREARVFQQKVASMSGLPVHAVDERLSSRMAKGILGSAQQVDSLAAQIILQNYLNQKKTASEASTASEAPEATL